MYKEAFAEAISAIKRHPFIDVNELIISEAATPELMDTFEMISGIRLSENIKEFYLFANGFKCIWSIKQNLSSVIMDKIIAEGEQMDFDYSKPLGAMNVLPLQDMLMDKYWKTPFQEPPESLREIQFNNSSFQMGKFAKKLKVFDAYYINNDAECMALLTNLPINGESHHLIMLDNYLTDWKQSNIIDFETYILSMCKTRFTIPSRKRLFSKKHVDAEILMLKENVDSEHLVPTLFK